MFLCSRVTHLDDTVGGGVKDKGKVYGVDTSKRGDVFRRRWR